MIQMHKMHNWGELERASPTLVDHLIYYICIYIWWTVIINGQGGPTGQYSFVLRITRAPISTTVYVFSSSLGHSFKMATRNCSSKNKHESGHEK